MSGHGVPVTYKGRSIGIVALAAVQVLVGFIHIIFGFWLLSSPRMAPFVEASGPDVYSIYTVTFGMLTLAFTVGLWMQKRWGWVGTVAVALFVIAADSLTLLDLQSIPGIPKFAGYGEITYSILILLYLMQAQIRAKYRIST